MKRPLFVFAGQSNMMGASVFQASEQIFYKNRVKNSKSGNNKTSQEIVDYILNISSYEVQVTVNVTSNKNSNKYILKQIIENDYVKENTVATVNINDSGGINKFVQKV